MGMCGARIYFEDGIPSVRTIKKQFEQQTGEYLSIQTEVFQWKRVTMNTPVISNPKQGKIGQAEKLKAHYSEEATPMYYLNSYHFDYIELWVEGNALNINFGIGQYYFPFSFLKVLFDLGGIAVDQENNPVDSWTAPRYYKKLKPWKAYKWYNRPRK